MSCGSTPTSRAPSSCRSPVTCGSRSPARASSRSTPRSLASPPGVPERSSRRSRRTSASRSTTTCRSTSPGSRSLVAAVDGVPMYFDTPAAGQHDRAEHPRGGLHHPRRRPGAGLRPVPAPRVPATTAPGTTDRTGDLGRISRQQALHPPGLQRAIDKGVRNPVTLNTLVNVGIDNVTAIDTLTPTTSITRPALRSFEPETCRRCPRRLRRQRQRRVGPPAQDTEANQERLDIFQGVGRGAGDPAPVRVAISNGTG